MKCPYVIKVCSKCKRILVANEMNFNKDKKGKYGLVSKCKECCRKYYEDNKEEIKEYNKKYYEDNKEDIKLNTNQYYHNNIEKCKESRKRYRKENKDKIKEQKSKYYNENKKEINKKNKQYREEHKEELKEKKKQYNKENPHIGFNSSNKRRQLEENQGEGISKEQWLEMMIFFNWSCAYSGVQFSSSNKKNNRSIDHIIPLSKGGEHEVWNCVPMLRNLNISKFNNNMINWYIQQDFYSVDRLSNILDWITYSMIKWKYTRS